MQSSIVRPALRYASRPTIAPRLYRQSVRRGYANEKPGSNVDTSPAVPTNPAAGPSRLPIIIGAIGAVVFVMVGGRYILASNKEMRSGHVERQEARKGADPSQEFRDPRDSGVKTLQQKKEKEAKESSS